MFIAELLPTTIASYPFARKTKIKIGHYDHDQNRNGFFSNTDCR
jgi:GTP1/Obg family GTP-binding protein